MYSVGPFSSAADVERLVDAELELVRPGRTAAFSVLFGARPELAVAVELVGGGRRLIEPSALCAAINDTLKESDLAPAALVVLFETGVMPATDSADALRRWCQEQCAVGAPTAFALYERGLLRVAEPTRRELTDDEIELAKLWKELLGVVTVEAEDTFFGLGGTSLKLAALSVRIFETFGVRLPASSLHSARSLGDLALALELQRSRAALAPSPVARRARMPLSRGELRLWFLWRLEPTSSAYNVAGCADLVGPLDLLALRAACNALVARHEALRTRYLDDLGSVSRAISPTAEVGLEIVQTVDERHCEELVAIEAARPFDLETGPLLRVLLLASTERRHRLVMTMHHIVTDAGSMGILVDDLVELYSATLNDRSPRLSSLHVQYADYVAWQEQVLSGDELRRHLDYWRGTLQEQASPLELPSAEVDAAGASDRTGIIRFQLPHSLIDELRALARRCETTLFVVLLAGFQALLHRYTGRHDVRVGVPVDNRGHDAFNRVLGFFVNTLVVETTIAGRHGFLRLVRELTQSWRDAQAHRALPFEALVEAVRPERSLERHPLFQVMFNHLEQQGGDVTIAPSLSMTRLDRVMTASQFELSLETMETDDAVEARLAFAPERLSQVVVERLAEHYLNLLRACCQNPEAPLATVQLLSPEQLQAQIVSWNATAQAFDRVRSVAQWFEQRVTEQPAAEALVFGDVRLTRAELDAHANRLAHKLVALGVGPDVLVGVCAERSAELVIALLAVLKAGGAYVPLDPEQPRERLAAMLAGAQPRVLLTQRRFQAGLPEHAAQTWLLDGPESDLAGYASTPPALQLAPASLAYCIYTSGSTGAPKGVANSHAGLSNRLHWMQETYALTASDRVLQKTPFGFDVSVWEFFWPLMAGAVLVVAPPGAHREPAELRALIERETVSVVHFVPSMLQAFVAAGELERSPSLRDVICSGEALPHELATEFRRRHPARLHNLYGPTEAAIDVSFWQCREEPTRTSVPIGRPIANVSLFVLDALLQPSPQGAVGELYIGGVALARGYQGRPDLTAERFVPNPFAVGERLYRTGDLVKYRNDAALDYCGRADQQVKIRGFRIELGEIEQRLRRQPNVAEAVVALREDRPGQKRLVAYVVSTTTDERELGGDLHAALEQELPEYMLPQQYVRLDRLPLSANGKLDRNALPAPTQVTGTAHYEEPIGALEVGLARIWAEVLRLQRIGRHDNFFELGGDSIVALQVVGKARAVGIAIHAKDLFRSQTLEKLARSARAVDVRSGETAAYGHAPLSPIQRWWLEQVTTEPQHFNQSLLLEVRSPVTTEQVERAVRALLAHHDSLRLRLRADGEGVDQLYGELEDAARTSCWQLDLSVESDPAGAVERITQAAHRSLDLEHGPLFRAVSISRGAVAVERLLIVIHHLAIDGVSWRILIEDLQALLGAGEDTVLPPRSSSFQAWSRRLVQHAGEPSLLAQLDHWLAVGRDVEPPVGPDPALATVESSCTVRLELSEAETRALLGRAGQGYRVHADELLLVALSRALCVHWDRSRVLVEVEGHGREALFSELDVSRTLGWFTTRYPVRLEPALDSLAKSIKSIKEQLRAVPDRGLGYGVLRYLNADGSRLAAGPQPRVVFNYLGQLDASFEAGASLGLAGGLPALSQDRGQRETCWFELNAAVHDERLQLAFRYNSALHSQEEATLLSRRIFAELRVVIDHCTNPLHVGITPSDFPLARLSQAELDSLRVPIASVEDIFPLSPLQEGILLHSLLEPGSGIYVMQDQYVFESELEPRAFLSAWQDVVDRHPALRSAFVWQLEGRMLQVVERTAHCPVDYVDLRGLSTEAQKARVEEQLRLERERGFDLGRAPLLHMRLFQLGARSFQFVQSYHHVLIDAWCRSILLVDFFECYNARRGGVGQRRPAPPPYRDFVAWLQQRDNAPSKSYWREVLTGVEAPTPLPWQRQASAGKSRVNSGGKTADVVVQLGELETAEVSRFAAEREVTVNTLAQGAWALTLAQHSGLDDVVFGVTVAGRPAELPGVQDTVGLFINSIPLRVRLVPQARVGAWLSGLLDQNLSMRDHEHLPLVEIQNESAVARGQNLFDSLFVFENAPLDASLVDRQREFNVELTQARTHTNYPITVVIVPGRRLSLQLTYDVERFEHAQVERLLENLQVLLLHMVRRPDARLADLPTLSPAEQQQLATWNETHREYDFAHGYAWHFEAQVARSPSSLAVSQLSRSLSYGELDEQAGRVASALRRADCSGGDLVGVLSERSLALPVAVLGVLKARAAYLPLDSRYPQSRLVELMELAGLRYLLTSGTQRANAEALCGLLPAAKQPRVISVDDVLNERGPLWTWAGTERPSDLAYAIFTSGSTGTPKAALVESQGMLNNQLSKIPYLGLSERDVVAQTAGISFDISVWQLLAGLLCGARVDIVPDEVAQDPRALLEHVERVGITVLESVPSLIQVMLAEESPPLTCLRWLLPTGEALTPDVARAWLTRYPHVPLVNAYGPAECSDDVALARIDVAPHAGDAFVSIGRATDNNQLHLLDATLRPLPVGIAGELYVAGVGVGRGYLADPARTATAFLPNPFALSPGERMYRTGDRARRRSDGELEFVGRVDHQVKLRGHRIELGEIEAKLTSFATIRGAAVVVAEQSTLAKRLVAYVVREPDAELDGPRLGAKLETLLPEHMLPAHYVFMDSLPLTANGKVNRLALAALGVPTDAREDEPPATELERELAFIWQSLLRVEKIGRQASFFELGGHSLLAVQVNSRIKRRFEVDLPLRSLFEAPKLAQLAALIEQARGKPTEEAAITPVPRAPRLALSHAQERLWFLWKLDPTSAAYNMPVAVRLRGSLNRAALGRTFGALQQRHESLRTRFGSEHGRVWQAIQPPSGATIAFQDLAQLSVEQREREARRIAAERALVPFDLEQDELIRLELLRLDVEDHVLLLTMHHIVSDGWSMNVIVADFARIYAEYAEGREPQLIELPLQYVDYAAWQRSWLDSGALERQLAYWTAELGTEHPVLELPTDRPRSAKPSQRGETRHFRIDAALTQQLRRLGSERGATLFMVLLAAFQVLLARYSGQRDVRIGVPNANRNREELEGIVGFLVNMQVFRAEVGVGHRFEQVLAQVRGAVLRAQEHQELPFERLVEALNPARSLAHSPLFQVMFNHLTPDHRALQSLANLRVEEVWQPSGTAQFELTLSTEEAEGGLEASFVYAADLFEASTIAQLERHLRRLLHAVVQEPNQRVELIPLLDDEERSIQLVAWNATEAPQGHDLLVHQVIEAQAQRTPEALAVSCAGEELTYRELNARANRLAYRLRVHGVGLDDLVAICAERSVEMVVGLLGIMKAGAAYVPLDPEYPAERLGLMQREAGCRLVLSQRPFLDRFSGDVWELGGAQESGVDEANLDVAVGSRNLAYCIYTSGSTGRPKAVGNTHGGLVNRLSWMQAEYSLVESDRVLQKTPYGFDVSVWEFFWPLMFGAGLVVAPPGAHREPALLRRLIVEHRVTTLHFVPSMLRAFVDAGQLALCPSIRRIICSGEALSRELVDAFRLQHAAELHNLYGPTEAAIDVSHWRCDVGNASIPIGRPIWNCRLFVLDAGLAPSPRGVVGELYIAGVALARGYLRRPDLTAERFVPDPHTAEPGGRLYRTGDLARFRDDGALEYLGRADQQVKLRGFRIELGEIEAALLEHETVRAAAVVLRHDSGEPRLIAYIVAAAASDHESVSWPALRARLQGKLPEYMVPALGMFLNELPLSTNGKLDRKALPAPDFADAARGYVAPCGELEARVSQVWSELLGVARIGRNDRFFDLGGHSLLAAQVVSRLAEQLGVEVPLRALFEDDELGSFAERVATLAAESHTGRIPLLPGPRSTEMRLSSAQQRIWFLWQLDPQSAAYNLPSALRLRGTLDLTTLAQAFSSLIERHESLRTRFFAERGVARQRVEAAIPVELPMVDLSGLDAAEGEARARQLLDLEASKPFDLEKDGPLRWSVLALAGNEHLLLVTLHHIAGDGWSMNVMLQELCELYAAIRERRAPRLGPLPIQYADYAAWQRAWSESDEPTRQLEYWQTQLGAEHAVLALPSDRPRPAVQSYRGAALSFRLGGSPVAGLRAFCQRQRVTPFMALLGVFQALLVHYTGQSDLRVGVPNASRGRRELDSLVGLLVNTQVFRLVLGHHDTFEALAAHVKDVTLAALAHQELPFERLVEVLNPERSLSHNPLFQVMFNHQQLREQLFLGIPGVQVERVEQALTTTQFDLMLDIVECDTDMSATFSYSTDLFDRSTIEQLAAHYQTLLETLLSSPQRPVRSLSVLSESEQTKQLVTWNATQTALPEAGFVHELFEARARLAPNAPALSFGTSQLSYGQLNQRANQLARRLRAHGVGPDSLVGVAAERSIELVVALLATMKAGAAYVPLDPEYPAARLAYVMQEARLELVLTQKPLRHRFEAEGVEVWCLDDATQNEIAGDELDLARVVWPNSLAYCIYTSGSTGRPKGVGNTHEGLVNRLLWMQAAYPLSTGDRVLQKTPYTFDVSVWEFFWPLMVGAHLVVAPVGAHKDPVELRRVIVDQAVTTLHFVPSMLQAFVTSGELTACTTLRQVMSSGEALSRELATAFNRAHSAALYNLYGPTEASIDVSFWSCRRVDDAAVVPIGHPIWNTQLYVLDPWMLPVAPGVVGELFIAGVGLARGYVRRPDLTAERFVPNPWSAVGERLYRTGDLARIRRDGAIEYSGRIDHQVKLRGLRIELGEIEACLLEHARVQEAVVTARADGRGEKRLVAYVVPKPAFQGESGLWDEVREFLQRRLPDYMVPQLAVLLERLPLTVNGKVDLKALPSPDASQAQREYVAPRSLVEAELASIWRELLGVQRIGIADNFFALGGDSIMVLQVVGKARAAGIQLSAKQLFEQQTIAELARVAKLVDAPAEEVSPEGDVELTPIQRWFFARGLPAPHHFNQSLLLELGAPLVLPLLEQALAAVHRQHDALRLRFAERGGRWVQWYAPPGAVGSAVVASIDLSTEADAAAAIEREASIVQSSFDLEHGPLLRAVHFELGAGRSGRLLLVAHHLVIDGVSWRILLEDLVRTYTELAAGRPATSLPKTSSFKRWSVELQRYAASDDLLGEVEYWREVVGNSDVKAPVVERGVAGTLQLELTTDETQALLLEAPRAYRAQGVDLLLLALGRVLCAARGTESVLVELEGHGREDLFVELDVSRTVGWFTSLFPVRLRANTGDESADLKRLKESLRAVPNKGVGFGILKFLRPSALPVAVTPRVRFNYLGRFDQLDRDGLFRVARESTGDDCSSVNEADCEIEVNALVHEGKLRISWSYRDGRASEAGVLLAEYGAALRGLTAHCLQAPSSVTPSDFPLADLSQRELDTLGLDYGNVESIYPMTPMQQGLFIHSLVGAGSGIYHMQNVFKVDAVLEPSAFRQAWHAVVQRHAVLRTSFIMRERGPLQIVHRQVGEVCRQLDWRGLDEADFASELQQFLEREREMGFDLAQPHSFHVTLIRAQGNVSYFVNSHHHILMDAWCHPLLFQDFFDCYAAALAGREPAPPTGPTFRDYVAWLGQRDPARAHEFWRTQLGDWQRPTPLGFMSRAAAGDVATARVDDRYVWLEREVTQRLEQLSKELRVTPNTFAQAAWAMVLAAHAGVEDVVFGVTVAGRPMELVGIEAVVGLFIQSIPLRVRVPRRGSARAWLRELFELNAASREYEYLPLTEIQRLSGVGREPLFDSLFVFENAPFSAAVVSQGAVMNAETVSSRTHTNYPITVVIYPGERLGLHLSYDADLFTVAAAEALLSQFEQALRGLVQHAHGTLEHVSLSSEREGAQISDWSSATLPSQAGGEGYVVLFERQVELARDRVAARCGKQTVTMGELNSAANRVGHALIDAGVRSGDVVGILTVRGLGLLATIVGVLKAGAAYLALDPQHPAARIREIVSASGAQVVLVTRELAALLDEALAELPVHARPRVLVLEELALRLFADVNLGVESHPHSLAYVIYTSGSTGTPKGVMVEQRGMLNNQLSKVPYLGLDEADVIAQTASQCFDISVWQLLLGPLCGAVVDIVPDQVAHDAEALFRYVAERRITILESVPSLIGAALASDGLPSPEALALRWLLPTGEALPAEVARRWLGRYPHIPLVNAYGPSECSDDVSLHLIRSWPEAHTAMPLGQPVAGTQLRVLGSSLELLPLGVAGELCISGVGVGRGYLSDPAKTAERFVPNPFDGANGERLYLSGDVVRRGVDGELLFVGRSDHQVKVRGHRIELGEIEARLLAQAEVKAVAVLARQDEVGDHRLVAYAVPTQPTLPEGEELARFVEALRAALRGSLPEYMVPNGFVLLEALPLTANGKLDRSALPTPGDQVGTDRYLAPRNQLESQLGQIWSEVLRVERVGVHDNFFDLGGHSLLIIRLASRIRDELGVQLDARVLFQAASVAELAAVIERERTTDRDDTDLVVMSELLADLESA
jgi:amino acid adenylation domain-containing protein/non-ribosomal peptide synthase protein (TIGR01720 family)